MIIAVRPKPSGRLELEPVGKQARDIVRESNKYDGTCIAYLDRESDIEDFLSNLSDENREDINKGLRVDVNIDDHTYRHMVGGQCD